MLRRIAQISTHTAHPTNIRMIRTAACLIIGDEVLNSKTVDTNSAWFAKYCFELGIDLRRIEVISDTESEIIEAVRRMSSTYDFVVTSGGIGPTHDDLTYLSIANAYGKSMYYHQETLDRMERISGRRFTQQTEEQATARKRMALFPVDSEVLFVSDDLWVPVVVVNRNVHIFPGIPRLFTSLLTHLKSHISPIIDPANKLHRILISTSEPESSIAPFLTMLSERVESEGIKVGSYPKWLKGVMVSLLGKNENALEALVPEVERAISGSRVSLEEEMRLEEERRQSEIKSIRGK